MTEPYEPYDENRAIQAKCLALMCKTRQRLSEIDPSAFPTPTSDDARLLLHNTIAKLEDPELLAPMDPQVLHNRLLEMQELVEYVSRSATDRISWPLVRYCNQLWESIFPSDGPRLFYSLTDEHNYGIANCSKDLTERLLYVLTRNEIASVVLGGDLYCLRLASLEDTNLPLYANIGHEFGHALYDYRATEFAECFGEHLNPVIDLLMEDASPHNFDVDSCGRVLATVQRIAQELVADLTGVLLIGPAAYYSLYEMLWGSEMGVWNVCLMHDRRHTSAYPSPNFRLDCMKPHVRHMQWPADSLPQGPGTVPCGPSCVAQHLSNLPTDTTGDAAVVVLDVTGNGPLVEKALNIHLPELQEALRAFMADSEAIIRENCRGSVVTVSASEVVDLLWRLEHDVPPNMVRDGSLLGIPATFQAILCASALQRLRLLGDIEATAGSLVTGAIIDKVERLTAKALEVSYVQREYNVQVRGTET